MHPSGPGDDREDGAYIARTRSGDRVITRGVRQSA